MGFTGLGSLINVQFGDGPFERPMPPNAAHDGLRELYFFDMLEAGIYLARRGMAALSLPVGESEMDRYAAAVTEFVRVRGPLIRECGGAA
jgi:glutamate-1-semialdehyde 2,1-aminomutase